MDEGDQKVLSALKRKQGKKVAVQEAAILKRAEKKFKLKLTFHSFTILAESLTTHGGIRAGNLY